MNDCRSVELRALCNEVPRTPPGPEGSNGTGIASGAADHPKFLALLVAIDRVVTGLPSSIRSQFFRNRKQHNGSLRLSAQAGLR
jgi:hypothetical protein